MMKKSLLLITIGVASFANAAPQAAIDACKTLAIDNACSIAIPRREVTGTCRQPQNQRNLLCVPSNRQQNRLSQNQASSESARRTLRRHTITQSDGSINTISADIEPIPDSQVSITIEGDKRILSANGVSVHQTDTFPNRGNPHAISEQTYKFAIPAESKITGKITRLGLHDFGLGINGVPFDTGAAEWYLGDRRSGWQYEAMSGAISLGLDENHAHVQPSGAYHYHGLPTLLDSRLKMKSTEHSPLIGWAADGFPIYSQYGYKNGEDRHSEIIKLHSSYQLKQGHRPSSGNNPGGHYDGTFVADYQYVKGSGELDECNGRITQTTEFPQGTYAYFLTDTFPIIPRCYKGKPSTDFTQQRIR